MLAWAKEARHITQNPARDVRSLRTGSEGIHIWAQSEIERFKAVHPLGTQAHLALMLLLLTGVRRSDAVKLGRQHEGRDADGKKTLSFTTTKNRRRTTLPLLPELQAVLDVSKTAT